MAKKRYKVHIFNLSDLSPVVLEAPPTQKQFSNRIQELAKRMNAALPEYYVTVEAYGYDVKLVFTRVKTRLWR